MANRPKVLVCRPDFPEGGIKLLRDRCDVEIYNSENEIPDEVLLKKMVGKDALFVSGRKRITKEVIESAGDQLGAEYIDLDNLLRQSDFVIVACPLTPETEAIVDHEALVHALKNKIIAAAGLDVMDPEPLPIDHPLIGLDNCAKNGVKVIATMSVGLDHIDLGEIKRTSIKIGYTPDVLTEATAELTVALLLATSRRVVEGHKTIVSGEWKMWTPTFMCGRGLYKSIVGFVGLGRIGQSIAKKLIPFGPSKILYSGPRRKLEGDQLGAEFVDFDSLLRQSDFVIVMCPLTSETEAIVDQESLVHALKNKIIAAAGLDVMTPEPLPKDHPLVSLDNCGG
ncbi:unnamed protein product [Nezara viridula]|uniref:D-isomer specific 2-hydroxyacid dehydrogenase NAD-binding domain-containing protein n=1 Tax=Nezara viridula TaxID=85310 RepID=A0A9P0MJK4_NEZVI|nr:unnamed protein product [Nezara viridula]